MNRSENLLNSIQTWIQLESIAEIVVLDWCSQVPVAKKLACVNDTRIRVIRVEEEPEWILSYAYNFAVKSTSYPTVLKLDADVGLKASFFQDHSLKSGIFFAADWRKGIQGFSGIAMFRRADFDQINGYNEFIRTYGWDDIDLYDRLEKHRKLLRESISPTGVSIIQHSTRISLLNQKLSTVNKRIKGHPIAKTLARDREFQNMKNRYIANALPWGKQYPRATYKEIDAYTLPSGIQVKRVFRDKRNELTYPEGLLEKAEEYALNVILDILRVNPKNSSIEEKLNIYGAINPPDSSVTFF